MEVSFHPVMPSPSCPDNWVWMPSNAQIRNKPSKVQLGCLVLGFGFVGFFSAMFTSSVYPRDQIWLTSTLYHEKLFKIQLENHNEYVG